MSSTASVTPGSSIVNGPVAAIVSILSASWLPRTWCMRVAERAVGREELLVLGLGAFRGEIALHHHRVEVAGGELGDRAAVHHLGIRRSPSATENTGPSSSSLPSRPHTSSPKCTSFTVANRARSSPDGSGNVVTVAGHRSRGCRVADREVVRGRGVEPRHTRVVIRAAWW